MRTLFYITVVPVVILFMGLPTLLAADNEIEDAIARIQKARKIQESEIATAHIKYRRVQGDKLSKTINSLTDNEIETFLSKINFESPEAAFKEVCSKMMISDNNSVTENELYWTPTRYSMEISHT